MIWFTADTHFRHPRFAQHRGFSSVYEHDTWMISEWNQLVSPGDTVYHLGDLSFGGLEHTRLLLKALKGNIRLIWGNHDQHLRKHETLLLQENLLEKIGDLFFVPHGMFSIHMSHYPIACWRDQWYGSWHLHGHTHGQYTCEGFVMDVGVDATKKILVSCEKVDQYMARQTWQVGDKHEKLSFLNALPPNEW